MAINIAIDGPSAAGKSTISKRLASILKYKYLDTGSMYRCCAYVAKISNININDEIEIKQMMDSMVIDFGVSGEVLLNGVDVSDEIRHNEISMLTSKISQISYVRETLVSMQQTIAKQKGYILDGRDIGTVVLPNAEVKIYLIASVEARANRRFKEYMNKGEIVEYDTIYNDIQLRDETDMTRKISPLKKAVDAMEVDSSELTIEETVARILEIIEEKMKEAI